MQQSLPTEEVEFYRRKADDLLQSAAQAGNMADRSRLIDEACYWRSKALDVEAVTDHALSLELDDLADEDAWESAG